MLSAPRVRALLQGIAEHSPYLWRLIEADSARIIKLLNAPAQTAFDVALHNARKDCADTQSEQDVMQILRKMKQETHLLIALADMGGIWNVRQVVDALTRMADAAVSCTISYLLRQAAANGKLNLPDPENPEHGSGLVVLGLGKHGAGELNYSSDIDLVVFFDPQSPAILPDTDAALLFVRMTRSLVKILQERTEHGYVLRVDLRLRPDPGSTSVAISLPAAFDYYESYGQNWERAAFIKARPVAGDLALGERFIAGLAPFIWRKYFDYAAIADIHAMKRQIHAVRGHADIAIAGHDVKLGRGGIREVEFFVQTQQLIFGGRRAELRGRRTLDMLQALENDGWVTQEAVSQLTGSYEYLRTLEHRLQMHNDEQTQRLPAGDEDLERYARFCGYRTVDEFSSALLKHLRQVEFHYARLFEHAPGLDSSAGSLVFTGTTDDPDTVETLRKFGFQDPSRAIETIRGWHFGRRSAVQSARAREVLTELVPALIESFSGSGDPDSALLALDHAMSRMPAAIELFSILKSNAAVRDLFGDILGGAPRLAQIVSQRPHVLDAAIDPGLPRSAADVAAYSNRLRSATEKSSGMEDILDSIRDVFHEEVFLISIRALSGVIDSTQAGRAFAALAEAIIAHSFQRLLSVFAHEHGVIAGASCVVLGLGKLGSREMTATSDLDIVMVYDFDEKNAESNGMRSLHASQYFARIAQRLISILTVSTRRGALYEVDMRLRPSGRQGPLATRFESFRNYQFEEAETWEHMALMRARFISGDDVLAKRISDVIQGIARKKRDGENLRKDIFGMRRLLAQEKGEDQPWDLKLASGGLIDVEFVAQYLCLRYAGEHPEIHTVETSTVITRAGQLALISPDDCDTLAYAHALYSAVTQMQRLTVGVSFDPAAAGQGVLRRIASIANFPDFRTLERELTESRRKVREIFNRLLG